ncbi:hypothetical protein MKX03_019886, partial [Papaver bracteatum]
MNELATGVAASAAAVSLTSPRVASPATTSIPSPTGTARSNSRSSNVSKEGRHKSKSDKDPISNYYKCADVNAAMPHMDAIKETDQSEESADDSVRDGSRLTDSTSTDAVGETKEKKMN